MRAEQFANDFDSTPPSEPEPVRPMPAWMGDELRKLRRFAIARRWAPPPRPLTRARAEPEP